MTLAALGMQDDLQRLNSISHNLANVATSGYKRQIPTTPTFNTILHTVATQDKQHGLTEAAGTVAQDNRAGTLRYTANPLDLAIDGDGFFEVMTERGPAYTRQAALKMDIRGRLVTEHGFPIMGMAGELAVSGTPIIARNGDVQQDNRVIGQIKVVQFTDPNALIPIGNGLFNQGATSVTAHEKTATLRAGYQENSNVNSPHEMVQLAETVRHFESLQKIMQGYDDVLEKTIRKLSEF